MLRYHNEIYYHIDPSTVTTRPGPDCKHFIRDIFKELLWCRHIAIVFWLYCKPVLLLVPYYMHLNSWQTCSYSGFVVKIHHSQTSKGIIWFVRDSEEAMP